MSKICQITGKKAMVGNNVSHSKRRTKRRFNVNLFTKKFYYVEQDCWISLNISAAGLRYINKVGLDAAPVSYTHLQGVSQQYLNYIERYKGMAIDQMLRYKIPASITLAQGLLESGAGTSTWARKANNHFGIKCGRAWKGPYVLQDDDERNEKFRKYRSVEESYEDHSRFLQQARYSSLFDLSPKDYKGWARGLKRCGYATNPRYASLLIDLIERYDLDQYDKYKSSKLHFDYSSIDRQLNSESLPSHLVYRNNENYYIIARAGDTFDLLAEETRCV